MKTIKEYIIKYREIIMYLIMGVATTVVSWLSYAVLTRVIPIDNDNIVVIIANITSWILAVLFAYITNKIWVFQSYSWKPAFVIKELALFISARLITGVIEWVGVPALTMLGLNQTILGTPGMLSKVLVSIIVVILNYIFSKLMVFKGGE